VNGRGGANSADLGGSSNNSDENSEDRRGEGFFCEDALQKVSRGLRKRWNATERESDGYFRAVWKSGDALHTDRGRVVAGRLLLPPSGKTADRCGTKQSVP